MNKDKKKFKILPLLVVLIFFLISGCKIPPYENPPNLPWPSYDIKHKKKFQDNSGGKIKLYEANLLIERNVQ